MTQLFRYLNYLIVFFVYFCSVKTVHAVNYKLPSIFESTDKLANLSSWTGKNQAVTVFFTDWCEGSIDVVFNTQLVEMWNNKTVPLITWQMQGCGGSGPAGITKLVNNNVYDSYINEFSDRLKTWLAGNDGIYGNADDRRAYLRLGKKRPR